MVVCRYFQEGRCRYGENCKFEHQRSDVQRNLFGQTSGSNTWSAKPAAQQSAQTQPQDLVLQLPREMDSWEKSKMWPFSCIAMEGETEAIPGFYDTSAEELRCEAYQGLKSGNMQPYIEKFKMLSMEFQNKRKELKNMPLDVKQKLVAMLEESRKKKAMSYRPSMFGSSTSTPSNNPFGQSTQGAPTASNPFGQSTPQTQGKPGLFGQSGQNQGSTAGLFGKPAAFSSTPPSTNSPFGNTGNSSTSVFGNAGNTSNSSASVFGNAGNSASMSSSVFGQTQKPSANPFASASTGSSGQSLFSAASSPPANANPFANTGSQGLFGKPAATQSSGSVFGAPSQSTSSVFGSSSQVSSSSVFGNQQKPPGLLGSAPSPFGAAQPPGQKPGLLGVAPPGFPAQTAKPGLLGTAPPAFSPQTSTSGQPSLFGGNSAGILATPQQGLFGKPQGSDQAAPQQSLFGKPLAQTQPQPGLFNPTQGQGVTQGSVASPGLFGSSQGQGQVSGGSAGLYTPLNDLTEVEIAEFKAQAFTLGRIPLRPPARELING